MDKWPSVLADCDDITVLTLTLKRSTIQVYYLNQLSLTVVMLYLFNVINCWVIYLSLIQYISI